MKEKIDPFILMSTILIFSVLLFFVYMFKLEKQDKDKRVEMIKEAIEKSWTPEQIKVLLEAR